MKGDFFEGKKLIYVTNNWVSLRWHKEISENGRNIIVDCLRLCFEAILNKLNQLCLRPSHPHLLHGHTIKATNVRPKPFLELQGHFVQHSHTWSHWPQLVCFASHWPNWILLLQSVPKRCSWMLMTTKPTKQKTAIWAIWLCYSPPSPQPVGLPLWNLTWQWTIYTGASLFTKKFEGSHISYVRLQEATKPI